MNNKQLTTPLLVLEREAAGFNFTCVVRWR